MVLLSISFENMHQILRNLYDTMTKLCHPMMDMAMALAALGALFYIAYRVWQSLSRAEPIDVFSMLRPFVLGMCILFFDVMVLGTLNGIFSPIVQGTGMLLRDQTFDLQKYQQEKDKLRADMMAKTMMTGPDGFYGVLGLGHNDDEEEVIAFGPVKVTQLRWKKIT
jgi:conjugative transposon TraJ protein